MVAPQRVLVIGANGFLGSHIVACATSKGLQVRAACREKRTIENISLDVCQIDSLDAAFQFILPSLVINCASYGVNYSDQNLESALSVNVQGAIRVLDAAARYGVARVLHIGSCFEYGHKIGLISEDAALDPTAIYGATKAAATLILRERASTLGINLLIARPFGVWGPREAPDRIIPQVIEACLKRIPLKLTPCEVIRDYTYVEDMADTLLNLALASRVPSGSIVNVGSGKPIVLREFVLSIAKLLGGESLMRFGELAYRPTEMRSLVADIRRLEGILGRRRPTPLREGLQRMAMSMDKSARIFD